jgi:CubicO group peptidase (beta-lactamase class C family)
MGPRRILLASLVMSLLLACGGGGTGGGGGNSGGGTGGDPWASVTAAVQAAQPQFPGGLAVEVMTPSGVVFSGSFGAFSPTTYAPVASASKMVSATAILRLVDQGVLGLDTKASDLLKDRQGQPWSGAMGQIRLRHLLSFTSGISGDVPSSDPADITLEEAVARIYEDQRSTATAPGSTFFYGNTHLRIAARMAEVATGKAWRTIFAEQLQQPLGWGVLSTFGGGTNPNPAGSLACTGLEYTRFLMLQLRGGLDGQVRLLSEGLITQQRADAFGPATAIAYSPYVLTGRVHHYGFGGWVEAANGAAPSASNPVQRFSSTGKFGWAPWIEVGDGQRWAAVILCQQPDAPASFLPSESLKLQLAGLIPAALARNPPVVRTVP